MSPATRSTIATGAWTHAGQHFILTWTLSPEPTLPSKHTAFRIGTTGLTGGPSGDRGRAGPWGERGQGGEGVKGREESVHLAETWQRDGGTGGRHRQTLKTQGKTPASSHLSPVSVQAATMHLVLFKVRTARQYLQTLFLQCSNFLIPLLTSLKGSASHFSPAQAEHLTVPSLPLPQAGVGDTEMGQTHPKPREGDHGHGTTQSAASEGSVRAAGEQRASTGVSWRRRHLS